MNPTIKAKNKKTGEVVEFYQVDYLTCIDTRIRYVSSGTEERSNLTEGEFNDLFEVVEEEKCSSSVVGQNTDKPISSNGENGIPKTDTLKKEDWRDIFKKVFVYEGNNGENTTTMMFRVLDDNSRTILRPEYIKAFIEEVITQEIAKAKEEIVEKIEDMKYTFPEMYEEFGDSYNNACDDIINLINNK